MFLQIYRGNGGAENVRYNLNPGLVQQYLEAHPFDLATLMDEQWGQRNTNNIPGAIPETAWISAMPLNEIPPGNFIPDHLIYAYMIENTRIYEIFEKVIFEFLHGEKLGFPTRPGTVRWLRATEELFYKSSSNYLIHSIVSNIRSDIRSSRRNAYYRMFAMDLNHGTGGSASYPYHKPADTNKDFVTLFEEFLCEVWIAISNVTNFGSTNPTDIPKMNESINRLRELLTTRKQQGNLYREEFFHVATMSWMHLTLFVDDAPIVQDMGISAQSPAERLRQMGEKVGLPAHPKADAFFKMAESISTILVAIELRPALNATFFFNPGGAYYQDVGTVITQWSIATGKDLKSVKVRPVTSPVPAR